MSVESIVTFSINEPDSNNDTTPTVVSLPSGNLLTAWLDGGSTGAIIGQLIRPDGSHLGEQITLIDGQEYQNVYQSDFVVLQDGRILMPVNFSNGRIGGVDLFVLNEMGLPIDEIILPSLGSGEIRGNINATSLSNGDIAISWKSQIPGQLNDTVFQLYSDSLQPINAVIPLFQMYYHDNLYPSYQLIELSDGILAYAYSKFQSGLSDGNVGVHVFDRNGFMLRDLTLSPREEEEGNADYFPTIISLNDGGGIVSWEKYYGDNSKITLQKLSSGGEILSTSIDFIAPANSNIYSVAELSNGNIVVLLGAYNTDYEAYLLDRDFSIISTIPVGNLEAGISVSPVVVAESDGGFTIVWKEGELYGEKYIDSSTPNPVFANSFRNPLGTEFITPTNDGDGYYVAFGFNVQNPDFGGSHHLGADWNGEGGGNTDLGEPVFAIGNATVVEVVSDQGSSTSGFGNYVVLRHDFAEPTLINGQSVTHVHSLYAHLESVEALSIGQQIGIGQEIGTLGMSGNANAAHLHIEITLGDTLPTSDDGYNPLGAPADWVDPVFFVATRLQDNSNQGIYSVAEKLADEIRDAAMLANLAYDDNPGASAGNGWTLLSRNQLGLTQEQWDNVSDDSTNSEYVFDNLNGQAIVAQNGNSLSISFRGSSQAGRLP